VIESVVINLRDRPDRLEQFQENYKLAGIDWPLRIFEAHDTRNSKCPRGWRATPGALGCRSSHLEIYRQAKAPFLLVWEDDAIFKEDFLQDLWAFVTHCPPTWDLLYPGGQHLHKPLRINEYVREATAIHRTHCMLIRTSALPEICQVVENFPGHIDQALARWHGKIAGSRRVFCPKRFFVGQRAGRSDINRRGLLPEQWHNC
jgi:hypothetical protein